MKRAFLPIVALLLLPVIASAKDLFVQSANAKIMSEPNFKAQVVNTVSRGDKLEQMEEKDGWIKVKTGAASGWVNHLAVAGSPPMDKVTLVTADAADIQEKSRKRSSAITSAAASRGLSDAERKRLSDGGQADYRAMAHLEQLAGAISEQDIRDFEAEK